MIRIVKVNKLRTPEERAAVVYVGRPFAGWPGHLLANPFRLVNGDSVGTCLGKYRAWLDSLPGEVLDCGLANLWAECEHGAKPLGCWCVDAAAGDGSPVVCHGQILAEMLRERFEVGS